MYFANILDGDEAHSTNSKFEHLLNLPEFDKVKNKVYVGDLKGYFDWFKKVFVDEWDVERYDMLTQMEFFFVHIPLIP